MPPVPHNPSTTRAVARRIDEDDEDGRDDGRDDDISPARGGGGGDATRGEETTRPSARITVAEGSSQHHRFLLDTRPTRTRV
jgi:hypothetical protein